LLQSTIFMACRTAREACSFCAFFTGWVTEEAFVPVEETEAGVAGCTLVGAGSVSLLAFFTRFVALYTVSVH
jgi:hypothetical protein